VTKEQSNTPLQPTALRAAAERQAVGQRSVRTSLYIDSLHVIIPHAILLRPFPPGSDFPIEPRS
jgi:hypothetical protein